MAGFRSYLEEKYSKAELSALGIDTVSDFDYGDLIREAYLDRYLQEDYRNAVPLYPDFLDFQMHSILNFWHRYITHISNLGTSLGRELYFSANTAELSPFFLPIADQLDYLSPELTYKLPPQHRSIPTFKLAASLGTPAFTCPNSGTNGDLMARDDMTTLMKIYTSEAYAAGGFLIVPQELWYWSSELGAGRNYSADLNALLPCRSNSRLQAGP